jgi:hypothetical protein
MVQNNKHFHENITSGYLRVDHDFLGDRMHLAYGLRYEYTSERGEGGKYDPPATTSGTPPASLSTPRAKWFRRARVRR